MINVVILNGGRGASTLIPAILGNREIELTSIVNPYDDGKSTGEIRRFFNMLGPSDSRKVQELFFQKMMVLLSLRAYLILGILLVLIMKM